MNIIDRLDEISNEYQEAGIDTKLLDDLLDSLYEDKKDNKGNLICKLIAEGVCLYVLGEDCICYDKLDCPIEIAGLWYCGEIGELVNKEQCKECNQDQDCGCCESVRNGGAPFNCTVCGRKKVKAGPGIICLDPNLTDEEVAAEVARCNEYPDEYFRC
jgi:hypothetical protein